MTTVDVIASQEVSFGVRTQAADGQFRSSALKPDCPETASTAGDRPLSILALSAGGAGAASEREPSLAWPTAKRAQLFRL